MTRLATPSATWGVATSTAADVLVVDFDNRLFDAVADALRSVLPPELGEWHHRTHRRGIKVWFGPAGGNKEHYESQVLARRHVDGTDGMTIETGFHAEHNDTSLNDAVIDRVLASEKKWRKLLGNEAEAGPFYGRPEDWRRISEVWIEPDLDDPELAFELAMRLTDYIETIEPLR